MREINVKKLLLLNLSYLFIGLYAGKIWQAWRLAAGENASQKLLHIADGVGLAFQSPFPSFYWPDLLFGFIVALFLRLVVAIHSQNAKKFRKGVEYGSARWGTAADIRPYIALKFEDNIILTQTERLTMNSRPKEPKTARNKNVLIVGGSGSGKTRFWVKPNLMQCDSEKYPCSFVVQRVRWLLSAVKCCCIRGIS